MSEKNEQDINLRTLRRVDPKIEKIKDNATQVAVYDFCPITKNWNKKDIEGSLFIVRRSEHPKYSFVIINRLSTVNMVEFINHAIEVKVELPFLLYKNNKSSIYCIWFYDRDECQRIANNLNELIRRTVAAEKMSSLQSQLREIGLNINDKHKNHSSSSSATSKYMNSPEKTTEKQNIDIVRILQNSHNRSLTLSPDANNAIPVTPIPITPKTHHSNGTVSVSVNDLFIHCKNTRATAFTPTSILNRNDDLEQLLNSDKKEFNNLNKSINNKIECKQNDTFDVLTPQALAEQQDKVSKENKTNQHKTNSQPPSIVTQIANNLIKPTAKLPEPANIEQFKHTLIHLIENDEHFLNKIHSTYMSLYHKRY